MKPVRALISVWDKTGVVELAQELAGRGVEILSTSKTAQLLRDSSIPVVDVADFTGAPEILGGRVKTLHPKVFGGILCYRAAEEKVPQIDIVVVSLYPFEENVKRELTRDEMIELIDIGGVSLIRAGAKNYRKVAVIPDRRFYAPVLDELRRTGEIAEATCEMLAAEAFSLVTHYDSIITRYLAAQFNRPVFGPVLSPSWVQAQSLRYGENPHQQAFYYADPLANLELKQLWGKELSYNNLLDVDATLALLEGFADPACTIIKHNTPCGVALHPEQKQAFANAVEVDPLSAFGGIVGFNRPLLKPAAEEIVKTFFEVIVAPAIDPAALEVLKTKKNLRVVEFKGEQTRLQIRTALAGVLVQQADYQPDDPAEWKVVSKRAPTEAELRDLKFVWTVTRYVRSNAIVLARDGRTVGVGAGQMSRVDSVEIAVRKSAGRCTGSVMGSDAFFPFRDSIDLAAANGVTAAAEPGGSLRDEEVIKAADDHGMALVFTGKRHFRH